MSSVIGIGDGLFMGDMRGPKCLGLGGMREELSASAIDCDESPWEGMGAPKSLGLGGRCGGGRGILQVWKVPNSNVNPYFLTS